MFKYVPAEQFVHVDNKLAPVAVEYVPFVQLVHVALPAVAAYVPGSQSVQADNSLAPVTF